MTKVQEAPDTTQIDGRLAYVRLTALMLDNRLPAPEFVRLVDGDIAIQVPDGDQLGVDLWAAALGVQEAPTMGTTLHLGAYRVYRVLNGRSPRLPGRSVYIATNVAIRHEAPPVLSDEDAEAADRIRAAAEVTS